MVEQKNLERQRSYILYEDPQYKTLYSALNEKDKDTFEQFLENATQEEINQDWLTEPGSDTSQKKQKLTHLAVSKKQYWAFEALQNKGANFLAHDSDGYTPLQKAILANDIETVKVLLPKYADGYDISTTGLTALHCAAISGNVEIAKLLMSEASSLNINAQTVDGKTPLHLAAEHGHVAMVNYLMSQDDIKLELFDANGYTPYHAAAAADQGKVIDAFLEQGHFSVDKVDDHGRTALAIAIACAVCPDSAIECLLKQGADVQYAEKNALTPLGQVVFKNHTKLFDRWISLFPQTPSGIKKPPDINQPEKNGSTLLHLAVCQGCYSIAENLIKAGANIQATDALKRTPLQAVKALTQREKIHERIIALLENPPKTQKELEREDELAKLRMEEWWAKEEDRLKQAKNQTKLDESKALNEALKPGIEPFTVPQKALDKTTIQNNSLNLFNPSIWFFLTLLTIAIGLGSQGLLGVHEAVFSAMVSLSLIALPLWILIGTGTAIYHSLKIARREASKEPLSLTFKIALGISIVLGLLLLASVILALGIGGIPSELPIIKPALEFISHFFQTGLQGFGVPLNDMLMMGSALNMGLTVSLVVVAPCLCLLIGLERLFTLHLSNLSNNPEETTTTPSVEDQPVAVKKSFLASASAISHTQSLTNENETEDALEFLHQDPGFLKLVAEIKQAKRPELGAHFFVKQNWQGSQLDDLKVNKGEKVTLIEVKDRLWMRVKNASGAIGYVPSGTLEGLPEGYNLMPEDSYGVMTPQKNSDLEVGSTVFAIADWKAEQPEDLTIKKGEKLEIIHKHEADFPKVKNASGAIGYVPLTSLTETEPQKSLKSSVPLLPCNLL